MVFRMYLTMGRMNIMDIMNIMDLMDLMDIMDIMEMVMLNGMDIMHHTIKTMNNMDTQCILDSWHRSELSDVDFFDFCQTILCVHDPWLVG